MNVEENLQILLVTDDNSLKKASESERFDARFKTKSWGNSFNITSKFDVTIIDGFAPVIDEASRHSRSRAVDIKNNFDRLSRDVKIYLKSGGVVIFLNADEQKQSLKNKSSSNLDWMNSLNLPRLINKGVVQSIKTVTDSSPIEKYLNYVDDTQLNLRQSGGKVSGKVLAKGRDSDKPVSMLFSEYKDKKNYIRSVNGRVILLPRPLSFGGDPIGILRSIVRIGEEYSPRGFSPDQKKLPDFQPNTNSDQDPTDYLIDDQLAERCLDKYQRREYNDAVSTAGRLLENRVKELCPADFSDKNGRKLMTDAFNPDGGPLRFAQRVDEQQGIMFLYSGAIAGIRNVAVHRPDGGEDFIHNFDKEMTRSILYYIDYLLTLLNKYEEN